MGGSVYSCGVWLRFPLTDRKGCDLTFHLFPDNAAARVGLHEPTEEQ